MCVCGVLHLVVEDLGFSALSRGDQVAVKALKNVLADLGQLGLDLLAVLLDKTNLGLVALGLLLLLDRGNDAPRRASGTDNVLVGDGQKVALVNGELTGDLSRLLACVSGEPAVASACSRGSGCGRAYLGDFLREYQHMSTNEQRWQNN